MAYFTKFTQTCNWGLCEREATYKVYNNRNAEMGSFCHEHAKKRSEELDRMERRSRVR